jgi:putative NADH-flavin reductase
MAVTANRDGTLDCMKKIGFLSFGHWTPSPQSQTRSAADALLQSIDLAVEAERLGMDGAYFRVHHFARQLASPFPLLAAVGAKTRRIEIGTAVIDMPKTRQQLFRAALRCARVPQQLRSKIARLAHVFVSLPLMIFSARSG